MIAELVALVPHEMRGGLVIALVAFITALFERKTKDVSESAHVQRQKLRTKVADEGEEAIQQEHASLTAKHAVEIQQYEVRELHLTATNTELLRQATETGKAHTLALQQVIADRDADRAELRRLNERLAALDLKVDETKKLHEECEQRLLHLQAGYRDTINQNDSAIRSLQHGRAVQDETVARLESQLEDANRRGYRTAKKVDEATGGQGAFRATDVWPGGKPRP